MVLGTSCSLFAPIGQICSLAALSLSAFLLCNSPSLNQIPVSMTYSRALGESRGSCCELGAGTLRHTEIPEGALQTSLRCGRRCLRRGCCAGVTGTAGVRRGPGYTGGVLPLPPEGDSLRQ